MHRVKELLSKSKYFGPDLDMQIDEIIRSGRLKRAEAGSFLINEGTKDDRLFLNYLESSKFSRLQLMVGS